MNNYNISNGNVLQILEKYVATGRLSEKSVQEITDVMKAGSLRIGIVGKMKAGKSSLVNALFFKKAVLPTGLKPMTVTLTEVTYGDTNRVVVEILNQNDIEDLRQAVDSQDEEKSKAAKEILAQIEKSPEALTALEEGKEEIQIQIDELPQYVAVGGKLSGIAKLVKIYSNEKSLQGITIVDTPGFNDPIISRGEATKSELSRCHILLFIHSIRDSYDSTEIELAKNQIAYDGISVIIDIVNQIDMLDTDEYPMEKWSDFVGNFKDTRDRNIEREIKSKELKQVLLQAPCLYASPLMALIGLERPISGDTNNLFIDYMDAFTQIKSQDDMVTCSNVWSIAETINDVAKTKESLLLDGPKKTSVGKLNAIKAVIEGEILEIQTKLSNLRQSVQNVLQMRAALNEERKQLKVFIENTSLSADFFSSISNSRTKLQSKRSALSESEYTAEIFMNPDLFSRGTKKRNNGLHNVVLESYCNFVRGELEVLKDELKTNSTSTINSLIGELIKSNLADNKDLIEKILRNSMESTIEENGSIIVPNEQISSTPSGNLRADALYKAEFLNRFDDKKIEDYLTPFETLAKRVVEDFRDKALEKIGELCDELSRSAKYSPADKDRKIAEYTEEYERLKSELTIVEEDIKSLS